MNPAGATRQIYWNISHVWLMYVLLLPTIAIFFYGFYRQVRKWRKGRPAARFDQPGRRISLVLKHALAQRRTARNVFAGIFHRFISYGFVVLTIATTVVAFDADFGTAIMRGHFYLYFQSFVVDLFGVLVLLGIGMAAFRRYIFRPKKLVYTDEATWILVIIALICVQGFLLEGWRIAATTDPWASYSPFGNLVARASTQLMSQASLISAHRFTWWFHLLLSFGLLAWFPFTKLIHVFTAPLNIYTAQLAPLGASLKNIDFEKTESFGVNSLAAFTWKDLLDFDACTECGRCTAVCPAHAVGKELSPRDIVLGLRDLMRDGAGPTIIGSVPATTPAALWQCTTCVACMEACPVFIEQMPKIVDMRRHLVMEEAEFPE